MPNNLRDYLTAHTPVIAIVAIAVSIILLVYAVRLFRRAGIIRVSETIAVSIGIGTSIEGMYYLATGPLHLKGVWVFIPAILFESAAIATGARAQKYAKENGNPGSYGIAVFAFATGAGIVTALNGHSAAECVFRFIAPMVGAIVWYQGIVGGDRVPDGFRLKSIRRLAIRLGLMEPTDNDVSTIHREYRVRAMTVTAHRYHKKGWLRRYHAARLRRLALLADDDIVSEVQNRVARVHRIESLTAPDIEPNAEVDTITDPDSEPVDTFIPDVNPVSIGSASKTAAIHYAHTALGGKNVTAPRIVAFLAARGIDVSTTLVYKVRQSIGDASNRALDNTLRERHTEMTLPIADPIELPTSGHNGKEILS